MFYKNNNILIIFKISYPNRLFYRNIRFNSSLQTMYKGKREQNQWPGNISL
ncbi:hypothetical protein JHK87_035795 [Glycine soja]|nr:hypothetical protein JHK87_035795 [Glycine soja]